MNGAVVLLFLLDFLFVGILPLIFFKRDGRLNLAWWLTAAPYGLCSVFLVAAFFRAVAPMSGFGTPLGNLLALLAVPFGVASIALISYTLGTHRLRIALWHQSNDAPEQIVTYGAYSRIRHPFYAAFMLALLGALIFCPHPVTLTLLLYGGFILNRTAAREERRLSESKFGAEYQAYVQRTGRFVPRWGRQAS
jgi:protein-S-isoprenylcysteine O-methyltransferase Ste14